MSKVSAALIVVTVVGATLSCRPRMEGATSATMTAAEAGGSIAAACRNVAKSAERFISGEVSEGSVQYWTTHPKDYALQEPFALKAEARFRGGQWVLSQAFGVSPTTPSCLVGRAALSHPEFMAALGCASYQCPVSRSREDMTYEEYVAEMAEVGLDFTEKAEAEGFGLTGEDYPSRYPIKRLNCEDSSRFFHATARDGNQLRCRPDTLYSWGPRQKISWLQDQGWSRTRFTHFSNPSESYTIFSTTDPIGSFGYGEYQIRLKIKSGVNYKYIESQSNKLCDDLRNHEVENTIIVRYFDPSHFDTTISGLDYMICGPGVIDSWSWGTQEALDEITRADAEFWRFQRGNPAWYSGRAWFKWVEYYAKLNGVDIFDKGGNPDSMNFNLPFYKANLARHRASVSSGQVYANPSGEGAGTHFSTSFSSYYNPD